MIQLYNDDCFDIFPKIKDKVDLVVVDLPFGQTSMKWDIQIDLKQMWIELKKICKKECIYVFFCTTKFGYKLIQSNEKWFRYDIVWEKSRKVGFLQANKQPLRNHEMVYIFKEKQGTYNPQKTAGKPYKTNGNKSANPDQYLYDDRVKEFYPVDNKGDRHPTSILHIPEEREHEMVYIFKEKQGTYNPQKTAGKPYNKTTTGNNNKTATTYGTVDRSSCYTGDEHRSINKGDRHPTSIIKFNNPSKNVHRTQKPTDLCEWLVKSYSNEGELVLDFTMGSGSTGIACKNTNRRFIGVEKDETIFKIAEKRLK